MSLFQGLFQGLSCKSISEYPCRTLPEYLENLSSLKASKEAFCISNKFLRSWCLEPSCCSTREYPCKTLSVEAGPKQNFFHIDEFCQVPVSKLFPYSRDIPVNIENIFSATHMYYVCPFGNVLCFVCGVINGMHTISSGSRRRRHAIIHLLCNICVLPVLFVIGAKYEAFIVAGFFFFAFFSIFLQLSCQLPLQSIVFHDLPCCCCCC